MDDLKSEESINKNLQCLNCCLDLTGECYVDTYGLPVTGKTITAHEALEAIFKGYDNDNISIFSLIPRDEAKFCNPCGQVFGKLLSLYTQFLELSTLNSMIHNLVNEFPHQFVSESKLQLQEDPLLFNVNSNQYNTCQINVELNQEIYSDLEETNDDERNRVRRSGRVKEMIIPDVSSLSGDEFIYTNTSSNAYEYDQNHSDLDSNKSKSDDEPNSEERPFKMIKVAKSPLGSYKCEICGYCFTREWGLTMHKEVEHKGVSSSSVDSIEKFRCGHCSRCYKNSKALRSHEHQKHKIMKGKPRSECTYYTDENSMMLHEGIEKFRCGHCGKCYENSKALRRHEHASHKILKGKPRSECTYFTDEDKTLLIYKEYKCDTVGCEVSLSTFKEWVLHQQEIHRIDTMYADIEKKETLEPKEGLIRPCPTCGKIVKTNGQVILHTKGVHLNLRPFDCSICMKKFVTQRQLDKHKEIVHAEPKYLCNLCGATFKTKNNMTLHEETHYDKEVPLKFECDVCHKKLRTKSRLKHHVAAVHSDAEPYQCDQCQKKFKTIKFLSTHKTRQHVLNITLPHPCELCEKRFSTKQKLKDHLMTRLHNLSKEEANISAKIRNPNLFRILPNGDRVYNEPTRKSKTCELCGRTYARREYLYTHLVKVHGKTEEEAKSITKLETTRTLIKPDVQPSTRKRKVSSTT